MVATIMPYNKKDYPKNWDEIARNKKMSTNWKCENCGKQCYRPGEKCHDRRKVLTVFS